MTSLLRDRSAGASVPSDAPATMFAATITAPGRVELQELVLPQPGPNQVRVALQGCGVCVSNLPVWEGRPWFNYPLEPGGPGHEGWGVVDALGEQVRTVTVGQRVSLLSYHAYATHDITDADAIVQLPSAIEGAFPGEPLGCAMNVMERTDVQPGQTICVVGIGFLGALLVQLAHHAGARVIAVARRRWACGIAEQCGADHTLLLEGIADTARQVQALTGGEGCARVIEVTGHQMPLDLASQLVRVRGKLVIAGYHQDGLRQVNLQQWNWNGIDVINAHERDPALYVRGMRRAVAAVTEGALRPDDLYTHRFPLEQLSEALEIARRRPDGFMKSLIQMPEPQRC